MNVFRQEASRIKQQELCNGSYYLWSGSLCMCERPLLHVQLKDSQKSCICQSKYLNGTIKTTMAVLCQICPYLEARNFSLELIITNATVKSCIFFLCYSYFYCSKCIHNLLNHGVYNLLPIIITPNLHLFIPIFPQYDAHDERQYLCSPIAMCRL